MTNNKHYSLQQLAKITKIPDSTVRYYSKTYSDFMPSSRLKGKKYLVYEHEAIEVLKTIRTAQKDNKSKEEVEEILYEKFNFVNQNKQSNKPAEQQSSNNKKPATIPQIPTMQIASQFTNFIENQTRLTEHYRGQSNTQQEIIEELKENNKHLATANEELRKEIEELKKREKPFFKNLF